MYLHIQSSLLSYTCSTCIHVMQGSYHIQHLDLSHNEFGEKAGEILGPALGTLLVCVTTVTMPVH